MRKKLYKELIKRIAFMVAAVMVLTAVEPATGVVQAAGTETQTNVKAPDGIYGNGRNGIYIDINSAPYTTYMEKDYGEYAYGPEGCAWFAAARANQLTGIDTTIWGGSEWYNTHYADYDYTRGKKLQAKALVCYGWHVAVVERVDGNIVTVSEGGYSPTGEDSGYTRIFTTTKEKLESDQYGGFLGYVYLKYDASCNTDTPLEGSEIPDEDITELPENPETPEDPDDNVVPQNGWVKENGKWRYLTDGVPVSGGWVKDQGTWYYLNRDTYMATGWLHLESGWYYLSGSGAMLANTWLQWKNEWYYFGGSGAMLANAWLQWKNEWYYFGGSGAMLTNAWLQWKNEWYYFDGSGAMLTNAWIQWKGEWYYLTGDGTMAADAWVGNYYVGGNGTWIPGYSAVPSWKQNSRGWWYSRSDGSYPVSCWEYINGNWYYFDSVGYMMTGWVKVNNVWYYLTPSGAMAHDGWIGNYYVGSNGAMYVSSWTPDGYYVGADGAWVPNM